MQEQNDVLSNGNAAIFSRNNEGSLAFCAGDMETADLSADVFSSRSTRQQALWLQAMAALQRAFDDLWVVSLLEILVLKTSVVPD